MAADSSFWAKRVDRVTVVTWNLQGATGHAGKWSALRTDFERVYGSRSGRGAKEGEAVVGLLQECGAPESYEVVTDLGGLKIYEIWSDYLLYVLEFGITRRVSTGVLFHKSLATNGVQYVVSKPRYYSDDIGERRLLCLQLNPFKSEYKKIWYCTIHAPSGADNPDREDYIRFMLKACKGKWGIFVCGGDYNVDPLENPGHAMKSLTVTPPLERTHAKGGWYDYVVTQGVKCACVSVQDKFTSSDHRKVIFAHHAP